MADVKRPPSADDRAPVGPGYVAPQKPRKGRGQSVTLAKERRRAQRKRTGRAVYRSAEDAYRAAQTLGQVKNAVITSYRNIVSPERRELRITTVQAAREVTKPSFVRYGTWISSCILMDVVGIVVSALNLSGVTLFFSTIFMWGLMLFMFIWGRLLLGNKLKQMRQRKKDLKAKAEKTKSDIRTISAQMRKFKKYSRSALRRFPKAAARMTRITKRMVKLTKFKSVAKLLSYLSKLSKSRPVKFIVEAIPYLQALPWWTIGAVAVYVEHKGEWKDAQRVLTEFGDLKREYIGITGDFHKSQLVVVNGEMRNALEQTESTASA